MTPRIFVSLGIATLVSVTAFAASAVSQGDAFPAPPQKPKPAPLLPTQGSGQAPDESSAESKDGAASADVDLPDLSVIIPRYPGPWQEGYDALCEAAGEDDLDEAITLADALMQPSVFQLWRETTLADGTPWKRRLAKALSPVFESFGWLQPGDFERAELRFAHGTLKAQEARVLLQEQKEESAEAALRATEVAREDFSVSRALAGPGELRRDATYSQSHVLAERAEEARLGIPEIREKLGLPALPPPAPPTPGSPNPGPQGSPGSTEKEDPNADLKAVRGLYLEARAPLLERILLGAFQDGDVQANLELIQRRLRELASIERQREEEEQQQDQQQQENQDPSESEDENQEGDPNQDSSENENQDSEPKEGEESENPPEDPEPGEEQQQPPEDMEDLQEAEVPEDLPAEDAERVLTREEVMRLLERLKQIEEEGESVRRQARRGQQRPVKRDW